jgi:hypothetical protein
MEQTFNVSDWEYRRMVKSAEKKPWSAFAQFTIDTHGYKFFTPSGRRLYRWEVWGAGYRDADALLHGDYPIEARYYGRESENTLQTA